ncbi:class III lanthionine synthetase LanKC [Polyangium sp. 15x6]|uniref:class III lanthionine synthetase LanKC n=1 Tax=Polyangium sp. 15x6 TaxID=3042687 RepID=UPI00249A1375|nr:class III lanthionine synthetase LanKC [Polyangium sp. 15x6]MDI3287828.1 class III lanthionine synthetase LanKC [Polyangium sp. 15x6]
MSDIERRARHNLILFTFNHPEEYSSLERYQSTTADFQALVKELLPPGWILDDGVGIWCRVRPPIDRTPEAGFKIHLSATDENARALLATVVPILTAEGAAFKFLADRAMLDLNNSSGRDRGSCGKFITVYPADLDRFRTLMQRLHEVTKGFAGPYILSDKRYEGSKVLFYRYGAFRSTLRVSTYGEMEPFFATADGRQIRDQRLPYFSLPDGIADPFPTSASDSAEPILKGRYRATHAMSVSSKGGVYRCTDLETGAEVVVKEGRPFVNRGRTNPHDAADGLKNEYEILRLLENTGVTPRALDFFMEWENSFLVMELAQARPLSTHMASNEGTSILLTTGTTVADVKRYCADFLGISERLIAGVRAIHSRGVAIQDLARQNVLFDPTERTVMFVDFESAYAERGGNEGPIIYVYTPGFGEDQRRSGKPPTIAADHRALSRLLGDLLYPVTPFFALAPERRRPMLEHVAHEKGLPDPIVQLILGVGEQPERIDALMDEAKRSLADIAVARRAPHVPQDDALRRIVSDIANYIGEKISTKDPLDLPTDYRRFTTNALSAAYGASGIACALQRVTGEVPAEMREALSAEAQRVDNDHYPSGLYVGTAGIAWAFLELGMLREGEALMRVAARSPIRFESADMFYGAAGHGLANLFFFERLGDEAYLANAVDAFLAIEPKLQQALGGYCYVNAGHVYHGIAHGASGIGYFLLRLHLATRRAEHLEYATGLLDFELASAEERQGQMMFRRAAGEPVFSPYWRSGSAGIGSVALRFHEVLGDERYLSAARRIARYLEDKYTVFPGNLCGMAGLGNFFVDMYRATRDEAFLEEARRFVTRIMLFALERPGGIVFPGEELLRVSTDYGTGSAGIGVFIHRILTSAGIPFFDF